MELRKLEQVVKGVANQEGGLEDKLHTVEQNQELTEFSEAAVSLRRRLKRSIPASGLAFAASTLWA